MGRKRPVTDVWGDRIEKETICGRNDVFVARFARLKPDYMKKKNKKTLVYRDTQRDWFSKYSHEIFRNIHLEYIQSDNDKNGHNNINGRSLHPVCTEKNTTSNLCFLRTFMFKQTHVCLL